MMFPGNGDPVADRVKSTIYDTIENLATLGFNHDGIKGLPMRSDVFAFATKALFSTRLHARVGLNEQLLENAGDPNVSINKDGTVDLFFQNPSRELNLTIQCGGVITYIKFFDDGDTTVEGTIRVSATDRDFSEVDDIIKWVHRG